MASSATGVKGATAQAKIQSNVSLVFKWFLHVLDYMYLHLYAQQAAYK